MLAMVIYLCLNLTKKSEYKGKYMRTSCIYSLEMKD